MLGALLLALSLAGCGGDDKPSAPGKLRGADYRIATARSGALKLPARVRGDYVELATPDGFKPRFWPGVNLGSTIPGRFPGEVAQSREDYRRWMPEMAALGVRAVRVYTILPPAFYEELRAYNLAHAAAPLFVIHGVWIPEERFMATGNAYDPEVLAEFRSELADAAAVVHGDATLPDRRGHASGTLRRRHLPLAAGMVGRGRVGSDRGPLHQPPAPPRAPVPRALHHHPGSGQPDGVVDRPAPRPPREARGPARLEPPDHVHELADGRPARAPDGAFAPGGPRVRGRDAHAGHRQVAGRVLRVLPRVSVLPGVPAPGEELPDLRAPRREGRPLRRLPAPAARPSQGPGGHGDRVRPADLDRHRAPRARSGATRAGTPRPTRPTKTPICCPPSSRRATPAGSCSSGPTSGSSSRGTPPTSRCPRSAGSCGATR